MGHPVLNSFHPVVAAWFEKSFAEPSPPQLQGWPLIHDGKNILLLAPTGSGKTLAAFLKCLDWLYREAAAGRRIDDGVKVLYISPLKALNNDIRKNLSEPLAGIARLGEAMGTPMPLLTTAVRTGDTPGGERQKMQRKPPQILITTPESLFLMLSSQTAAILQTVHFVIVDEIHTLFPTKRGAHLAVSLERLQHLVGSAHPFQRIGLSATMRPLDQIAAYLGGYIRNSDGSCQPREVVIVDTGQRKTLDLKIILPVPHMQVLAEKSIWPPLYRKLVDLIAEHRTTLIFVNNRRQAEKVTANINQIAGRELARTHHGSISKEVRLDVEEQLKSGVLSCIVATASLELGIDIGTIDLVVQIESPKDVARGLQRVGRAGHLLGMPSKGRIIPKTSGDLLEAAAIMQEMTAGRVEPVKAPRNCLDILAQQLVAMTTQTPGTWAVESAFQVIRSAYTFTDLSRKDFENVLKMLSGLNHGGEYLDLKPRLRWDQLEGQIKPDPYGKRLVYSSGGTIPDRGYFGVYMAGTNVRLGELDEEFVYERRLNERFVLGTSLWKIEEIRQDRVIVSPSKRGEAMIPFWKADQGGRSFELGKRIGAFYARAETHYQAGDLTAWLESECALDADAAKNLEDYLSAQCRSIGNLPNDSLLVVEEFPDETGEWRVLLHSPFGVRLHQALGLLIQADWKEHNGLAVEMVPTDDGIMFHCPGGDKPPGIAWERIHSDRVDRQLAELVSGTPLFGTIFRHAAGRALVMPRTGYGRKRTPLWLARLKAGNLLQLVAKFPDFPLIVEAYREILQDYYETEAIREFLTAIQSGTIGITLCRHKTPSPFAQTHLFNFINSYMYESDAPRGESRTQLFGLGRETLRTIMGPQGFRDLFAPEAVAAVDRKAQGIQGDKDEFPLERIQYWIEKTGDVSPEDLEQYFPDQAPEIAAKFDELQSQGKVKSLEIGPNRLKLWVAAIHWPDYATALKSGFPPGVDGDVSTPDQDESEHPAQQRKNARHALVARFSGTHGPFQPAALARRYGLPDAEVTEELAVLSAGGVVEEGEFIPGGQGVEWCDVNILNEIHRRSLTKARRSVAARPSADFLFYLARWQGIGARRGLEGLATTLEQLDTLWLPAEQWEKAVFPARISDYRPSWLDQLSGSGQFHWRGQCVGDRLMIRFETTGASLMVPHDVSPQVSAMKTTGNAKPETAINPDRLPKELTENAVRIIDFLKSTGAVPLPLILQKTGMGTTPAWSALEELIGAGRVTNDSFGPIRYILNTSPKERMSPKGVLNPARLAKMGRWSLVEAPEPLDPSVHVDRLLKRYGLLCRETVSSEETVWGEVYPTLDYLEMIGKLKRGYFVEGLSGIQYATPEVLDELRGSGAGSAELYTLSGDDPANGSRWVSPANEQSENRKISGDFLVFFKGNPILAASGRKIKLQTLSPWPEEIANEVFKSLITALFRANPAEKLIIASLDGVPIVDSGFSSRLERLGFERSYREMTLWPSNVKKEILGS